MARNELVIAKNVLSNIIEMLLNARTTFSMFINVDLDLCSANWINLKNNSYCILIRHNNGRIGTDNTKDEERKGSGMTMEMLKAVGELCLKALLKLLNTVRAEKTTHKDWKIGNICLMYKKGDGQQCANCKGIILGSTAVKICARILESWVRKEVEHTLEEAQSGFRKRRRTQNQIFILRQVIDKAIKT